MNTNKRPLGHICGCFYVEVELPFPFCINLLFLYKFFQKVGDFKGFFHVREET